LGTFLRNPRLGISPITLLGDELRRLSNQLSGSDTSRMPKLTVVQLRAQLGPSAADLSDAELECVNECLEGWAAAIFEWWLRKRNGRLPKPDSHEGK
jgi:hypothetical protein